MRSTLFFIPHAIGGIPLFGFGLLLGGLLVALVGWIAWSQWKRRPIGEVSSSLPMWGIAAAIVIFVLPNVEQVWPDGTPLGLPIRGYGVMVLLGLLLGIGISIHRGRQLGIDPDLVVGLGFWMMLGGVLGARIFYVVQKWHEFAVYGLQDRLVAIVKLTEGGLVIYGGVIGGLIAGAAYCMRHKLKLTATADLVAPGFLIGLSLGRIGCLLHGCCFGGICTANLPTIQFPHGSGPYQAQLASAQLVGIELEQASLPSKIAQVVPGSAAAKENFEAGQNVESIRLEEAPPQADWAPTMPLPVMARITVQGQNHVLLPDELPKRSLPVHPSQIYAAINALLLCIVVWHLQPVPQRDGVTFLIAIILYSLSRFMLEGIRSDEGGQLGTSFTIAQLVSIASGVAAALGLVAIGKLPPGRGWKWPSVLKRLNRADGTAMN